MKPSLYFAATGCLHPEERYDQNIHIINNGVKDHPSTSTGRAFAQQEIQEYLDQDIAWKVSLNASERHMPSRQYVLTGKLYPDEPFDPQIHKHTDRNIRHIFMGKTYYYYPELNNVNDLPKATLPSVQLLPIPPRG